MNGQIFYTIFSFICCILHIHMLVVHVANKKFYRYKKLGNLRYQSIKHGNHFTFLFPTLSQDNLENLPYHKVRIPDHKALVIHLQSQKHV